MGNFLQELRYALRSLRKSPAFAITATLTLALGIGANTAIFTVVNAVLLRPLPYSEPERLVRVFGTEELRKRNDVNLSTLDVVDIRQQSRSFEEFAALSGGSLTLTGQGEPERLPAPQVTYNFFSALKVQPHIGRFFQPGDEQRPNHRVAVLSFPLWQRRFGGDPAIVGKTIKLSEQDYLVAGVAPEGFQHPLRVNAGVPQLWVPVIANVAQQSRGSHFLDGIARLRPGVSIAQAQADLNVITARLASQYPFFNAGRGAFLMPLQEAIAGDARTPLLVLLGAVGFVLLIACANVANLMLVRAAGRRKEMAIRAALGAGRWQIVRQLLMESSVLALLGGTVGVVLSLWGTDLLVALGGRSVPRAAEVHADVRVLAFAMLLSLVTGIIFGLVPALRLSRPNYEEALREEGRGGTAGVARRRYGQFLVATQVALSLVLLAGAGLLGRSLWHLMNVDPGITRADAGMVQFTLPSTRYAKGADAARFAEQVTTRIAERSGIAAAAAVNIFPLSGSNSCDGFIIKEYGPVDEDKIPCAEVRYVTPEYFRAMGIPLRAGRLLTERDTATSPPVMVINEAMARQFFPNDNPIGKHVNYNARDNEVVGVVGNVKHFGLAANAPPELYTPFSVDPVNGMAIVARANANGVPLATILREEIHALDKDLALTQYRSVESLLSNSVAEPRFRTVLLGIFAALALLVAAVGIYGVLASNVVERLPEFGIRMALGAGRRDVLRQVLGEGLAVVALGMAAGLAGAMVLARSVQSLLFEVKPADPMTLAGVTLLLGAVAMLACWLPARRATRVDPMVALRHQ